MAQLVRVLVCHTRSRGFEPRFPRTIFLFLPDSFCLHWKLLIPTSPFLSLSLADKWAQAVSVVFLAPCPSAARLHARFPLRKASFLGLYKPSLELLFPQPKPQLLPPSLARAVANPRVRAAAAIRVLGTAFAASNSPPSFFLFSLSLSLSRARASLPLLARRRSSSRTPINPQNRFPIAPAFSRASNRGKPSFLARISPNSGEAPPAAAVEPSHPEPLDRNPTAENRPDSSQTESHRASKSTTHTTYCRWRISARVFTPNLVGLAFPSHRPLLQEHYKVSVKKGPPSPPPSLRIVVGAYLRDTHATLTTHTCARAHTHARTPQPPLLETKFLKECPNPNELLGKNTSCNFFCTHCVGHVLSFAALPVM
nr:unnamed protein product [Digitaria exilis]